KGMAYHTVNRLLTRKVENFTYETIERLCLVCGCTPDDLFVWRKDEGTTVAHNHPLYKLKPKLEAPSPVDRIKKLTPDKLKMLQDFMDGLEKE
ncbi:MAG: helix-turn-helix domain-containing protein, partial [Sphingobacteriales bacterium]